MANVDLQCPLVSLEHKKPGNGANFSGWDFIRNTSGQIQEENANCPSASVHHKQSWASGLQETCQPLGFSLPPTKQDFTHSCRLYVHESPCLAIFCRVTSPVSWRPASRGAQQPCCPAAEAPERFFVEINEGETWLQSPEHGWDRSQARTSAVPPRPHKM